MARWGFSPVGFGRTFTEMNEWMFDEDYVWRVQAGANPDLRYAVFVERGTKPTPAQPYMTPAIEDARRKSPLLLADAEVSSAPTIEKFVELVARHIHKVARKEVPIDTGALKDSIEVFRIE